MVLETVATQIKDMIENDWAILNPALADVYFATGWYEKDEPQKRQIIVSHVFSPPVRWFGAGYDASLHTLTHEVYQVDCWYRVDRGDDPSPEGELTVWNMKEEVFRILNVQRKNFIPPIGLVIPLDRGRQLNEQGSNRQPRMFRWSIRVQANYKT